MALVCAASKGLGRASALALARDGVRVAICSRGGKALHNAAAAIESAGGEVLAIEADLRRAADIARAIEATVAKFGGLDILVTNTGGPPSGPFMSIDETAWKDAIDSLLLSVVRLCRAAIPHMQARGGGRIINVTTVGGKAPAARSLPTSMSRAAGINLTKSLAHEYAPDRILVNTICLGLVKSAQHERRAKGDLDAYYRELSEKRKLPLGRFGEAHEFADLVAFLASERAAYITGTAINFDGGITAAV